MSTAQTSTETTALPAGVWTRDPIHSSLEFSVKHMVVATFRSSLPDFDSTLTAVSYTHLTLPTTERV